MKWLIDIGYKMNYPRWEGIQYTAKYTLSQWKDLLSHHSTYRNTTMKQSAMVVIGFQPFSGLRGEWIEDKFGTVFYPKTLDK